MLRPLLLHRRMTARTGVVACPRTSSPNLPPPGGGRMRRPAGARGRPRPLRRGRRPVAGRRGPRRAGGALLGCRTATAPPAAWTARLPSWLHPYPAALAVLLVGLPLLAVLEWAWRRVRPATRAAGRTRRLRSAASGLWCCSPAGSAPLRLATSVVAAVWEMVVDLRPWDRATRRWRPAPFWPSAPGPGHAQVQPDDAAVLPRT